MISEVEKISIVGEMDDFQVPMNLKPPMDEITEIFLKIQKSVKECVQKPDREHHLQKSSLFLGNPRQFDAKSDTSSDTSTKSINASTNRNITKNKKPNKNSKEIHCLNVQKTLDLLTASLEKIFDLYNVLNAYQDLSRLGKRIENSVENESQDASLNAGFRELNQMIQVNFVWKLYDEAVFLYNLI